MSGLPATDHALVVRTDFSNGSAWARIRNEMETPVAGFRATLSFLSDPAFEGLRADELTALARRGPYRTYLFAVDQETVGDPEHPILVLDLADEPGRTFRVIPPRGAECRE
jgi:hypothetical protein